MASQDGVITIFRPEALAEPDQDTMVKIMPSARSTSDPGTVRSMCFSPEPWDLLVCTEQSGRICVLDVRDHFRSRQTICLTTQAGEIERAEISEELIDDERIDPRLREADDSEFARQYRQTITAQDEAAAAIFAADYVEASSERRRMQRQTRDESPQPFTERERQILEALRTSRQRIEARGQLGPASISYAHDSGHEVALDRLPSASGEVRVDRRQIPASWALSTPLVPSLRDYIRDRNPDRERTRTRTYEPRRHGSALHAPNDLASTGAGAARTEAPFTMSPPRLPPQHETSDPWQTIEAAMASGPLPGPATRSRRQRDGDADVSSQVRNEVQTRLEQRRRERLRNLYAEVEGMGRYGDGGGANSLTLGDREAGLGTAGCAMSEDGSKL